MRRTAVLIPLLCLAGSAQAIPLAAHGGGAPAICTGSPAQDGCTIFPVSVGTSATLTDLSSNTFQFRTNTLFVNGSAYDTNSEMQINSGGKAFVARACPTPGYTLWQQYSNLNIVPTPTTTIANSFTNVTAGLTFNNWNAMVSAGSFAANQTLEIAGLTNGMPIYQQFGSSDITQTGATIILDSGAKVGCGTSEGDGWFAFDSSAGAINNVTIKTATGAAVPPEVAYAQHPTTDGQARGISMDLVGGFTITGPMLVHDNDFGIESGNGNWTDGTVTITDVTLYHNGSPANVAPNHNMYIGTNPQTTNLGAAGHPVKSYCLGYPSGSFGSSGFELKARSSAGTWVNVAAAEPDPIAGNVDCFDSGAIDLSCGGVWALGAAAAGSGIMAELGPQALNNFAIRFGAEINVGLPNCPSSLTGFGTNTLLVQNAWINLDLAGTPKVVCVGPSCNNALSWSVTVKNSTIVCNGTQACNSTALGTGVTDGGGNTYFASRAAAGQSACSSISVCPLHAIP